MIASPAEIATLTLSALPVEAEILAGHFATTNLEVVTSVPPGK
jgi:hypothetical protein